MKDWWKFAFGILGGLLAAGLIWLVSAQPHGEPVTLLPPPTPAPIIVHVTGAVQSPGVYALPAGSRVSAAIEVAGGLLPEASAQTLNLAAILQDGSKVLVPFQPTATSPADIANPAPSSPTTDNPININIATQAELESLPGIGPVIAQRIIEYRQANGPFASIEDIQNVSGIGPKTFERIQDLITVGP